MKTTSLSKALTIVPKILQRIADGETLTSACLQEGIPPRMYYSWMAAYPEIWEQYQKQQAALLKATLAKINDTRQRAFEILSERVSEETPTRDLLEIARFLEELRDKYQEEHEYLEGGSGEASSFLAGIARRHVASRMEIKISVEADRDARQVVDGEVTRTYPVVQDTSKTE